MKQARISLLIVGLALPAAATAQTPHLSSGESFAVLAGAGIANSGSTTVAGDVGVGEGGTVAGAALTFSAGGTLHTGDAVAVQALTDASELYADLGDMTCTSDLTGQDLGGKTIGSGVYCFDGDAPLTAGTLTLTGPGPWIFVIDGALTSSAPVVVSDSTRACNGSNVFWRVAGEVTVATGTTFLGNIVSQSDVVLQSDAAVDGRAFALDPAATVTLTANTVTPCSFGNPLPVHAAVKVTGGGQINVPGRNSKGVSNYGFNATPLAGGNGGASGQLNYRNHVSGLQVDGTVTDTAVLTLDDDGSPDLVRISGTCTASNTCTFSVVVEDNGEPGRNDRFGIAVVGSDADETTLPRVVKNGNIQVHLALTTTLNSETFRAGDVMTLTVSVTPGTASPLVDSYLVLQLPNGQLLSWTGNGFAPGLSPLSRGLQPAKFRGVIAQLAIPPGAPAGEYAWLSAHTAAGTPTLVSDIAVRRFRIKP